MCFSFEHAAGDKTTFGQTHPGAIRSGRPRKNGVDPPDEARELFHEIAEKSERLVDNSVIDKALALRRMTEANGATPAEAATALKLLGRLMAKNHLTASDLDEHEKSRG